MKFSEIRDLIKNNKLNNLDVDITICVMSAVGKRITDEEFELLCNFTQYVWYGIDKGYTQLLADIVVDLYLDEGYDYRDEEEFYTTDNGEEIPRLLTMEQIKAQDSDSKYMVIEIFNEKYYDC